MDDLLSIVAITIVAVIIMVLSVSQILTVVTPHQHTINSKNNKHILRVDNKTFVVYSAVRRLSE